MARGFAGGMCACSKEAIKNWLFKPKQNSRSDEAPADILVKKCF
jgi:hypothetical protein